MNFPDGEATAETLYYTGSTTKSFTAAAVSLLIDDTANSSDPLQWTTPISTLIRDDFVLPDEYATAHVTLEDALSHRTGMPRHDTSYGGPNFTVRDVVRNLRNLPMTAEIRTKWQYCNMMFVTMSHVIESLTGMWLGDFLRIRIWEPLSMSSTYFSLQDAKDAMARENKVLARGYFWDNGTQRYIPEDWLEGPAESGDGAIISSVMDYSKYLRAMIDKAPPISPSGHAALRTPRSFADPVERIPNTGPTAYALGWELSSYCGETIISHSGAVKGFGTIMVYLPWRKWGFAMMGNTVLTSNAAEQILTFALLDNLLETPPDKKVDWKSLIDNNLEKERHDLETGRERLYPNVPKEPLPLTLPLKQYTGVYSHPGYGTLNLTLAKPTEKLPFSKPPAKVLHADLLDRTWLAVLDLEHISGEYFLVYISLLKTDGSKSYAGVTKAECRMNGSGKVEELGIAIEEEMGEDKIWFKKIA